MKEEGKGSRAHRVVVDLLVLPSPPRSSFLGSVADSQSRLVFVWSRMAFIRKVYTILSLQLLATAAVSVGMLQPVVLNWTRSKSVYNHFTHHLPHNHTADRMIRFPGFVARGSSGSPSCVLALPTRRGDDDELELTLASLLVSLRRLAGRILHLARRPLLEDSVAPSQPRSPRSLHSLRSHGRRNRRRVSPSVPPCVPIAP